MIWVREGEISLEEKDILSVIMKKMKGYSFPYYFATICELGIFEIATNAPCAVTALCKSCELDISILRRLLRPLIALGLVDYDQEKDTIFTTNIGNYFTSSNSNSLLSQVKFHGREGLPAWSDFLKQIKDYNGKKPKDINDPFKEQSQDCEKAQLFYNMMHSVSSKIDMAEIIRKHPEIQTDTIVDVGGGVGTLALNLLSSFELMNVIVFDLPHLKHESERLINACGLATRCAFVAGDFFDHINVKGDHFILSRIMHDWSDETCAIILKNIKSLMTSKSKLFIIEKMLPEYNEINVESFDLLLSDLNVWCMCKGKERTYSEIEQLLLCNHFKISNQYQMSNTNNLFCFEASLDSRGL